MRIIQTNLLLVWTFLLASCDTRPRAPVLRDDPVYQNDREGFRFLAPEGWKQTMRGEAPPGVVEKERTLVEYRRTTASGGGASLRASLIDLPASTDLAEYLARPSYGAKQWHSAGSPEDTEVGSATGVRYRFSAKVGKQDMARDVVAVRRNERVYFFTVVYPPKDTEVRDQLHKVVASVIWKE